MAFDALHELDKYGSQCHSIALKEKTRMADVDCWVAAKSG